MNIPDEFNYLLNCFWDGSIHEASSLEEWVSNAMRLVDERKRKAVRPFLTDIVSRSLTDAELERLWSESGARFYITDPMKLRQFLQLIHDEIAAPGKSP